jgi:hypothetical protein
VLPRRFLILLGMCAERNFLSKEDFSRLFRLFGPSLVLWRGMVRPYLHPGWVSTWDALELLQMITLSRQRLFGCIWRGLPPAVIDCMARRAQSIDLSAAAPGGGQLIVAEKPA